MCGIAGYVGYQQDAIALHGAMQSAIRYRGRDGEGEWARPGEVALFHSRLSVLDIEGGAQPMTDTDGRYVIVFNGEIYNYLELRRVYEDRKSVVSGKSVSVRLDLGGRRIIKKKKKTDK